jgi:transcriptional regulator with XRE-family HTH domain
MTTRKDEQSGKRWPPSGFGGQLARLREARGWSQEQLAREAGVSVFTVSKLERGAQEPAWPFVLLLARTLGVEVGAFVPEPEGKKRKGNRP